MTNHAVGTDIPITVSLDKLTLLWRYPPNMIEDIVDRAEVAISCDARWYLMPHKQMGSAARLIMFLPDDDGQPTKTFADLRISRARYAPHGFVRLEFNPAKASEAAPAYIFHELAAFLPETSEELFEKAYVTRFDLAVDVPGIRCRDLAAQRTSHHKNAEVFVGADGHVNSIRIGARGSSTKTGTFLRIYDKPLPHHDQLMGVRAEVEVSRSGHLATTSEIDNPFAKFRIYHFPSATNQGLFGFFISAVREKGPKRALAMLSDDKARVAEFQGILDQCRAPWWDPDLLWAKAWCSPTNGLEHDSATPPPALGHAA